MYCSVLRSTTDKEKERREFRAAGGRLPSGNKYIFFSAEMNLNIVFNFSANVNLTFANAMQTLNFKKFGMQCTINFIVDILLRRGKNKGLFVPHRLQPAQVAA